jgi:hypothetical protein
VARFQRLALRLALASAVVAGSALGQTPPPSAAPAPTSRGKVVVIADLSSDETENAKLRAAVYETARSRGYDPDPGADVTAAATSSGTMKEGRIATDEASLESLRKALGASLLIRVAPEGPDKARLVVISEQRTGSGVVGVGEPAVTSGVSALLGEIGAKEAPAATGAAPPPPTAGAMTSGSAARRGVQTEDEEPIGPAAVRERWEARGGLRASYEIRAMLTGLAHPDTEYQDTNRLTGATERGKATTYGVGGGLGVRLSLMYLPLSQPQKGSSTFGAFRFGTGVDGNVLYYRPPVGYDYKIRLNTLVSRDTEYDDQARLIGIVPIQLGFLVGFGEYRSDSIWRGSGIGLAYSPAFVYALEIGKTVGDVEFNYGGVEASIDIISIEANRDGSSEPQIRLAVLVLPRVRDELPWLLSAGIGIVWY